ncbi:hypothetical protein R8Z50_33615 [Longispora sp. K20-0274]|uniref:hypothetical protein n=1 Tax=Longispora sp. K20-0274 TaxID=3088255 RepID=UPI00399ACE36
MRASRALVVLALLALPACTSTARPEPLPAPSPSATARPTAAPTGFGTQMILLRNGGLKGGSDMWKIEASGAWRLTDADGKKVRASGTLTAVQLAELAGMLNDPALPSELATPARPETCPDGITYVLNSGPASGVIPSCGLEAPTPHFVELAAFVGRVTATN